MKHLIEKLKDKTSEKNLEILKNNAKKQAQFDADLKKLKKKERNSPLVNLMRSQNKSTLISFGNIKYSFDNNIFKKTIDVNQFKESYLPAELDEENRNLLMTMLSQYKVNFKYTFASPIKNISIADALFSLYRKTFSKEYSLIELLNNPELNNFTVELED